MTENPAIERSPGGDVPGAGSERLFSLDLLRGLDVFWLVIVQPLLAAANKTWTLPEWLRAQLVHNWGVFGLFDFAQPLFIFICGAAVPLAIPKRLTPEGRPTREFWRHVLWRVALLWTCGMLIRGILLFDRTKFTPYSDTLQTIAAGYFFACLAMLIRSRCVRVALPFVLIAIYSALCVFFGDWTLSLDWSNTSGLKEEYDGFLGGSTFHGCVDFAPSDSWDFSLRGNYVLTEKGSPIANWWNAGAVVHFFPLRDSQDLRLHAFAEYDSLLGGFELCAGLLYNLHFNLW